MIQELSLLEKNSLEHIQSITSEEALILYKNDLLWKTGQLTVIIKWLKDLSPEDRQTVGKYANTLRDTLNEAFDQQKEIIKNAWIERKIQESWVDVTEPLPKNNPHLHPITQVRNEVEDTFRRMGFDIHESMEVTTEYLNFDAVNVPKTHPARDMQDTFWLEWTGNVLATQTSSMQNILLKSKTPPIRALIPGRVFRNEDVDATHENTFYQVEGIVVDKNISMGHLKYTIKTMLSDLFWKEVTIRMRPWYFPFVEPGVEVDFSCPFCNGDGCKICKKSGWIEFMGAGLIHPNVIREGWLDPEVYTWFAFGFGLNRLVMIKYGIPDMRYFQNPDLRFLNQF